MKEFFSLLFLLLVSVRGILGQTSLADTIAELPTCALVCLETALINSTCSATNQTCVCTNAPLQAQVTLCVEKSCTVTQALLTRNVTETSCGVPVRDRSKGYYVLVNVFGALSGFAVVLRLVSKISTGSNFGMDDYFIFITLGSGIPSTILTVHGLLSNGLGRDIWTLAPKQITGYLHVFYVIELLYFAQVSLLKLSLLFFYLRIFPAVNFRRFLWATIIFDITFGIVFVIGGAFQCHPIDYYWNQWDGEHEGKCVNVNVMGWANAVVSILLDIWMLGLAISQLIHLQLHWKKKVGVALMFALGTFVTVVSILRLQSLLQFAKSVNLTWDNFPVTQWSNIEINVGIICACMPSMRILLVRMFPAVFGSNSGSKNTYYAGGSHVRIGTNVSVGGGKEFAPAVPQKNGIMFSQSYEVGLDTGEDESRLVPLHDLNGKYSSARNPGGSSTSGR